MQAAATSELMARASLTPSFLLLVKQNGRVMLKVWCDE
jgi:hypothetical protein